ncbi:MAG TPA: NTF2 fold immunity protein [Bacteroidia bacterium]|jgi:hypothetical protein|nr:NTF2 fold immunity protein [Bacteroidia bacterium]
MRATLLFLLVLLAAQSDAQKWHAFDSSCIFKGRMYAGKKLAERFYAKYFNDTIKENSQVIPIRNEEELIQIAEPKLFRVYGKKEVKWQMPYEIYLISGYWIIEGTFPKEYAGGVVGFIINAENGHIVHIMRGK